MKKRIVGAAFVAGLAVLVTASTVQATPPQGVRRTETIGTFEEDIEAKTTLMGTETHPKWQARIDTKGATDVHFVENTIAAGGTLGWRSHPGPLIVVVKKEKVVLYRFDGSICTREEFTAGSGWVEQGDSVATVHNESDDVDDVAVIEVAALTPKGVAVRIDVREAPTGTDCPGF
jgi:hypothetical protein